MQENSSCWWYYFKGGLHYEITSPFDILQSTGGMGTDIEDIWDTLCKCPVRRLSGRIDSSQGATGNRDPLFLRIWISLMILMD